jgi:transposase-like protein
MITTDGYNAYVKSVKSVFGYHNFQKNKIEHNVLNISAGDGFNIMVERLHNNIRQRTKVFRGFHGSVHSANAIMKGYEIYYNFITRHQTLNCCPYELATELKLSNENKWIELIGLASPSWYINPPIFISQKN